MDVFAPFNKINTSFIVKNVSPQNKTITIFQYPINMGGQRDLLAIPGVAEQDIRASLLKGEIQHKFLSQDIQLVYSDIDLLQFNSAQRAWLTSLGFTTGTQIGYNELDSYVQNLISGGGTGGITPTQHEIIRQLIHFIDEGPGDGFASGAYKVTTPTGPFPTSIIWYVDNTQTQIIVSKTITYNANQFPSVIVWSMYDFDGITIVHTVTDTITYNSAFESTRTRAIS